MFGCWLLLVVGVCLLVGVWLLVVGVWLSVVGCCWLLMLLVLLLLSLQLLWSKLILFLPLEHVDEKSLPPMTDTCLLFKYPSSRNYHQQSSCELRMDRTGDGAGNGFFEKCPSTITSKPLSFTNDLCTDSEFNDISKFC